MKQLLSAPMHLLGLIGWWIAVFGVFTTLPALSTALTDQEIQYQNTATNFLDLLIQTNPDCDSAAALLVPSGSFQWIGALNAQSPLQGTYTQNTLTNFCYNVTSNLAMFNTSTFTPTTMASNVVLEFTYRWFTVGSQKPLYLTAQAVFSMTTISGTSMVQSCMVFPDSISEMVSFCNGSVMCTGEEEDDWALTETALLDAATPTTTLDAQSNATYQVANALVTDLKTSTFSNFVSLLNGNFYVTVHALQAYVPNGGIYYGGFDALPRYGTNSQQWFRSLGSNGIHAFEESLRLVAVQNTYAYYMGNFSGVNLLTNKQVVNSPVLIKLVATTVGTSTTITAMDSHFNSIASARSSCNGNLVCVRTIDYVPTPWYSEAGNVVGVIMFALGVYFIITTSFCVGFCYFRGKSSTP